MHISDRETILAEIESRIGVRLPDAYREFVLSDGAGIHYLHTESRWFLAPLAETDTVADDASPTLTSMVAVSGKEAPFIGALELHAQSLSELVGVYINDAYGNSYELKRLSGGIAIGEAEGNLLYLDRFDRFSVWCYYQKSGDVELLAKTFETWLKGAVPDLPEPPQDEPEPPVEDPVVRLRAQQLKSIVRKAIDRYLRNYLIPKGDLDEARVYSNAADGILENGYERAIDQVATEIVDELTRKDTA